MSKMQIALLDSKIQTLDEIPSLKQGYRHGIDKQHRVFEIKIALANQIDRMARVLDNAYTPSQGMRTKDWIATPTSINRNKHKHGPSLLLILREVAGMNIMSRL